MNASTQNIADSADLFLGAMQTLWQKMVAFVPNLVVGVGVLIVGVLIATAIAAVARRLLQYLKLDKLTESSDTTRELRRAGLDFSPSVLISWLIKWFFILGFLIMVANIWQLSAVTLILDKVVVYIPNVVAALLIISVGIIASEAARRASKVALKRSHLKDDYATFLSEITRWIILVFSLLAALSQLKIADQIIMIVVAGFVFGVSLASGLAFGLGSIDRVKRFWQDH